MPDDEKLALTFINNNDDDDTISEPASRNN